MVLGAGLVYGSRGHAARYPEVALNLNLASQEPREHGLQHLELDEVRVGMGAAEPGAGDNREEVWRELGVARAGLACTRAGPTAHHWWLTKKTLPRMLSSHTRSLPSASSAWCGCHSDSSRNAPTGSTYMGNWVAVSRGRAVSSATASAPPHGSVAFGT